MKNWLFVLLMFSSVGLLAAEKTDAMLFGDVKSQVTGEHIPYANIVVKGTNLGTAADGTGHYKLAHLPVGNVTIVARAVGYKAQEKTVLMERGKAVDLFFVLDEDVLEMEQVVVTGTRTQHYIKDVPVRTEVITARDIENKNASNLFEALESIPGIRVESQCQYCNFTMVRMQGLGAEHTQVLINGQPVYSGLAGVYGLQQVSTVDVGQIEVIKGAGSALYGSSAVAGAINIISKEPAFEPSVKVGMQFGNYHTNDYNITSSLRNEKGNIGLNIFAQRITGDAIDETGAGASRDEVKQKDGISDRVASNLTNAGFGLYISNALFENDKMIIRGKAMSEKRQGGTMTDDYYKNPLTDGTESIFTDRYEAELSYNQKFTPRSEINFSLAYAKHDRDATNDSFLGDYMATHEDNVPDVREMRPYLANENSFTSTLSYAASVGKHNLLIGVQSYFDDLEESGMYVVVNPESEYLGQSYRSISDKSAQEFGVFVQDEWNAASGLTFVPGIRFDNHNSSEEYNADRQVFASSTFPKTDFEENSVNPRLAVKYAVSNRVTVRANAGTGFRAPYGFSEDLHLCSGSPRVWKSSSLNPEKSVSYNLSLDYYGNKFRLSSNIFRTDLQDKIAFSDADAAVAALGYDYQWENIDDAFVQGVEVSLVANLTRNLDLGIDVTYNQGEYDNIRGDWEGTVYAADSKYISRLPQTTANLKCEYSPAGWNVVFMGNFQGPMYIDYFNEEIDPAVGDLTKIKKTESFMLFNARISKQLDRFKLFTGVDNIFNYVQEEKYLDDAAFMYAPVYGTLFYGGLEIDI